MTFKTCTSCRRPLSKEDWLALPLCGIQPILGSPDGEFELRNCGCGSTLSVPTEETIRGIWGVISSEPIELRTWTDLSAWDLARMWAEYAFGPVDVGLWLARARCFDPRAAAELAQLGVSALDAAKPVDVISKDHDAGYWDTLGFAVARGDMTPEQAAGRLR